MITGKTLQARKLFEQLIKDHQCYEGQICICTATFTRKLMNPIIDIIKNLEAKQ